LESELFGHAKGAFTGAIREHKGLFERANGGTLFLDEVAELPLELQAKLLRVLQEMTFFRLGGTEPITVDVRIVSATHRSLREEVAAGRFRADLMYRLRVVPVFLPPLRERRNDIPVLLNHFLADLNARGHRTITRISPEAMRLLLDYQWPGNIRELKNVLEYAFAVGHSPVLQVEDLPPEFRRPLAPAAATLALPAAVSQESAAPVDERQAILKALHDYNGHVGKAAESLGMSRPTFWRKRKAYGV
jgi:DNA-binding NtrC family response regulator